VIPWCEKHGVAVVAYSPFGHNDFPNPRSEAGKVLQKIADAHGATPRQIALTFLTRRAGVFAIPKASVAAHAADNAGAGIRTLSAGEIAMIEKAFPLGPEPDNLPML
jgi:diketogulonate reductase-like aldo/keto reductase